MMRSYIALLIHLASGTGSAEVSRYRPDQTGAEASAGQANVKEILPLFCKVESLQA